MKTKIKYTLNEVLDTLKEKKIERNDYKLLYKNFETQISKDGYMKFRLTEKDKWKNVHTLVNQYFNLEEHDKKHKELIETSVERWLVTHHINFFEKENKLNNHPDNLQWLGWDEHRILHQTIMREIMDKIWNTENPEYCSFEAQREKIRLASSKNGKKYGAKNIVKIIQELWHGENNVIFRKKMSKITSKNMSELNKKFWHGENNEEYRKKILPTQIENGKKNLLNLWHGENNLEFRKNQSKESKKKSLNLWHGENSEIYREKMKPIQSENATKTWTEFWKRPDNEKKRKEQSERIKKINNEMWYGENNEEFRKNHSERMLKQNSTPEFKKKSLEGKIFKIFKKILKAGEEISNETFIKYKFNGAPYPITVFGSIEIAIEKLKYYHERVR